MSGLSATAKWIACARAAETLRTDRLFDDPLAIAFLEHTDIALLAEFRTAPTSRFDVLAVRTKYFDDQLIDAVSDGTRTQVVILGAGLDARAFRLDWPPGVRLYELDLPELITDKRELVANSGIGPPTCEHHTVAADLTDDWPAALTAAGFDSRRPTVWLVEGILYYLTVEQIEVLLARLTALSAPRSVLCLEQVNTDLYRAPWMRQWLADMREQGRPWRSGVAEPERWLAGHGWAATVREPSELPVSAGRLVPRTPPRDVPGAARTWLVTARLCDRPDEPEQLSEEAR